MNKTAFLLIGAAVGAGVALALTYLLGPADETTYDENYRSRLDFALEQGKLRRTGAGRRPAPPVDEPDSAALRLRGQRIDPGLAVRAKVRAALIQYDAHR